MLSATVQKNAVRRKTVKKSSQSLLAFLTDDATDSLIANERAKANARDLATWCASAEGFLQLEELAKRHSKFALLRRGEYEDLQSMVALQLIELGTGPTADAEFTPWLLAIVKKTAGQIRNEKLRERRIAACDT